MIKFGSKDRGKLDMLKINGKLKAFDVDPNLKVPKKVSFTLIGAGATTIASGSANCTQNGVGEISCRESVVFTNYSDRSAKSGGGIAKFRIKLKDEKFMQLHVQYFGDLSGATSKDMCLRVRLDDSAVSEMCGAWTSSKKGWKLPLEHTHNWK